MNKIMIIGSGGAGKSTLAKQLGDHLQIPVYHLDAYFWKPGWQPIQRSDLASIQQEFLQQDAWIIDGNYSATMDIRLQAADTVIFLNYSTWRCIYRIVKRRIQYQGRTRPDMGEGCPERLNVEFIRWVANYQKRKAPVVKEKLRKLPNSTVYQFNHPKQTKQFLHKLTK